MATPTYTALATTTLSGTDSEIVFSSIPATYRDLVLQVSYSTTGGPYSYINFNGDSSNYTLVDMIGNGSTATSTTSTIPYIIDGVSSAVASVQIQDYSATDKHKTSLIRSNLASSQTRAVALRWASTSAITSISIKLSGVAVFNSGSTFSLYGIAS